MSRIQALKKVRQGKNDKRKKETVLFFFFFFFFLSFSFTHQSKRKRQVKTMIEDQDVVEALVQRCEAAVFNNRLSVLVNASKRNVLRKLVSKRAVWTLQSIRRKEEANARGFHATLSQTRKNFSFRATSIYI
jgi:hypothetical protein